MSEPIREPVEKRQRCQMRITRRGEYYLAGYVAGLGGIVRSRIAQCARHADDSGYCWQHRRK